MKKTLTISLSLLALLFFTADILAQPQMGMRQGQRGRAFRQARSGGILAVLKARQEELNITDEQLEEIQGLILAQEESRIKHQNELNIQQLELKKAMADQENRDYAKIKTELNKLSDIRNDMFVENLKSREAINNVLTPEQQKALRASARGHLGQRARTLRNLQRFRRSRSIIR